MIDSLYDKVNALSTEVAVATDYVRAIASQDTASLSKCNATSVSSALLNALQELSVTLTEFRHKESEKAWVAGESSKVNQLLQQYQDDLNRLADEVLKKIAVCCGANQGALYMHDTREGVEGLEMIAMYAYGKKKHLNQRIDVGQGLAGQVFLEGGITILTEVPPAYVKITSGLGEATPRCVVICCLELNGKKNGIIELAFFARPKEHQLEFLKNISESIARSFHWVKESDRRRELLEHSQTMADQLKRQEQELKASLEKMQEIHAEMEENNSLLAASKLELEKKNREIEEMNGLIESKMEMQKILYEAQINKLRSKVNELRSQTPSPALQ